MIRPTSLNLTVIFNLMPLRCALSNFQWLIVLHQESSTRTTSPASPTIKEIWSQTKETSQPWPWPHRLAKTPPTNSVSCLHGDHAALHYFIAFVHDRHRRLMPLTAWHPSCEIVSAQEREPALVPAPSRPPSPGNSAAAHTPAGARRRCLSRPLNQPGTHNCILSRHSSGLTSSFDLSQHTHD